MSQQDNFSGGFVLGAIVGGIVGGVVGAVVTSQRLAEELEELPPKPDLPDARAKSKRRMRGAAEQNIELARRGLEDKIAQLNDAIDDVRQQLGTVNGRAVEQDVSHDRENLIRED
jgi:hypothetical protein